MKTKKAYSQILCLILFVLIVSNYSAQTISKIKIGYYKGDTINYKYMLSFNNAYEFKKITEGKSNYFYKAGGGGHVSFFQSQGSTPHQFVYRKTIKLTNNDTLFGSWWYLQKYDSPLFNQFGHNLAKVTLNQTNNTIRLESTNSITAMDKKSYSLNFKIIKLSEFEIILLDLDNIAKNRRYYFQKKSN